MSKIPHFHPRKAAHDDAATYEAFVVLHLIMHPASQGFKQEKEDHKEHTSWLFTRSYTKEIQDQKIAETEITHTHYSVMSL